MISGVTRQQLFVSLDVQPVEACRVSQERHVLLGRQVYGSRMSSRDALEALVQTTVHHALRQLAAVDKANVQSTTCHLAHRVLVVGHAGSHFAQH